MKKLIFLLFIILTFGNSQDYSLKAPWNGYLYFGASVFPSVSFDTTSFTISYWGRNDTTVNNIFMRKVLSGDEITLTHYSNGENPVYLVCKISSEFKIAKRADGATDYNWHHFVIAVGRVNANDIDIYIDGVEVLSYDININNSLSTNLNFSAAYYFGSGGTNVYGNCALDEIAWYTYKLNQAEAQELYNNGTKFDYRTATTADSLMLYMNFNTATGYEFINDVTGVDNNVSYFQSSQPSEYVVSDKDKGFKEYNSRKARKTRIQRIPTRRN